MGTDMEGRHHEQPSPKIYFPEVRAIIDGDKTNFLNDRLKDLTGLEDKKDTLHHSQRITNLGYLLYNHLNITSVSIEQFVEICLLHDIGKKDIPSKHLTRQFAKFAEKDMNVIRQHPRFGYTLLKNARRSPRVYNAVLLHHQFQPKPYPKIGAEFREIESCDVDNARLLSILDVFDTCAFGRPYVDIKPLSMEGVRKALASQFNQSGDEEIIDFLCLQYEKIKDL